MTKRKKQISPNDDATSVAYIAAIAGAFVAYLGAEITLAPRPHPIHWLVMLSGGALVGTSAYGITLLRQRRADTSSGLSKDPRQSQLAKRPRGRRS